MLDPAVAAMPVAWQLHGALAGMAVGDGLRALCGYRPRVRIGIARIGHGARIGNMMRTYLANRAAINGNISGEFLYGAIRLVSDQAGRAKIEPAVTGGAS